MFYHIIIAYTYYYYNLITGYAAESKWSRRTTQRTRLHTILLGGDQFIVFKGLRLTSSARLDGLVPMIEDWHLVYVFAGILLLHKINYAAQLNLTSEFTWSFIGSKSNVNATELLWRVMRYVLQWRCLE